MKRKIVISLAVLAASVSGFGQSLDRLLDEVIRNNAGLKAQQTALDLQKLENRVGNTPANPQVEGAYLWGSPNGIGNRTDFSFTQQIEFPTVYHHRAKLADLLDRRAEISYEQFELELKQEAAALWVELVSLNQALQLGKERLSQAEKLADAYELKLTEGEGNRLDRNKAALNALQARQYLAQLMQEKDLLQASLNLLNGANAFPVEETEFDTLVLPADKDNWIAEQLESNPLSRQQAAEREIAVRELRLNQSKALPSLSGGYMLENTPAEKFSGVTLGLSIPLWESKNTVKAARLNEEQRALRNQAFQIQFKNELEQLYRAVDLASERVKAYRIELAKSEQSDLLSEALAAGQISLIDYLVELQFNYEAIDQLLLAEKDLQLAWVKLKVMSLQTQE